jgi:hypothetical protein
VVIRVEISFDNVEVLVERNNKSNWKACNL